VIRTEREKERKTQLFGYHNLGGGRENETESACEMEGGRVRSRKGKRSKVEKGANLEGRHCGHG
jgi:hypothetical protein